MDGTANFPPDRWHPHSQYLASTPTPIVDTEGRVIGILAGKPIDDRWDDLMEHAAQLLHDAQAHCHNAIKGKRCSHRRGEFTALRAGVSHGGGQTQPGTLGNNRIDEAIIEGLNAAEPFQRLAGFSSCMYLSPKSIPAAFPLHS